MMAPSGKFWMAMPSERASAPAAVICAVHALRDVVQRNGQHHHGGALQLAVGALSLLAVPVQVRDDMIQQQQKQDPHPETHHRREKRQLAEGF